MLNNVRGGRIELVDAIGHNTFGSDGALHAKVHVLCPRFYRKAFTGGPLAAAEAFIGGDWDCDDLTSLFRIFVRSAASTRKLDRSASWISKLRRRIVHRLRANTKSGSRRNIAAHYDLGNDFFRLWLDDTLAYSSGIFPGPESTLREASVEKFERICRKLQLSPNDHLLEIGTGWGGLAIHAAENYGCRVTTTTISRQQYEVARERIDSRGLSRRITLLSDDYRDLTGEFDKLVSVEMIEAVGHRNLDAFFGKCGELLKPHGSMLIQAIVMPEQDYSDYLRSVDFIQKYVFPGGCLPSIGAMLESTGRATDLRFVHCDDFGLHYAETLRRWRHAFHDRIDEVRQLGYTEEFLRLWEYYLCYCEAAFEEHCTSVVQVMFDKPGCRRSTSDFARFPTSSVRFCSQTTEPKRNSDRFIAEGARG
ncbi:MAG: class I SAM-dependent methyltransferase [Planctomycetaceae bacterium]